MRDAKFCFMKMTTSVDEILRRCVWTNSLGAAKYMVSIFEANVNFMKKYGKGDFSIFKCDLFGLESKGGLGCCVRQSLQFVHYQGKGKYLPGNPSTFLFSALATW